MRIDLKLAKLQRGEPPTYGFYYYAPRRCSGGSQYDDPRRTLLTRSQGEAGENLHYHPPLLSSAQALRGNLVNAERSNCCRVPMGVCSRIASIRNTGASCRCPGPAEERALKLARCAMPTGLRPIGCRRRIVCIDRSAFGSHLFFLPASDFRPQDR